MFEHIGAASVHQLLLETYDGLPTSDPKAAGALCLLIRLRPAGWAERVDKFIDERVYANDKDVLFLMLLEVLSQEYRYKPLRPGEIGIFEKLIAKLIGKAKNWGNRLGPLINRMEQRRATLQLIASTGRL
jgi:hypothetical protein